MDNIWTFFTFPLNLLLAVLWMAGWRWLWRRCPSSAVMRFMLSPAATVLSIVLLTVSCLWLGFSGDRDFVRSVSFVAMLLFVQTVVYLIILRGWRRADGVIRWRFLLIHAGFLLAVGAGFWGSPDSEELRMVMKPGESSQVAFRPDGSRKALGYGLGMTDYDVEYSIEGKPSHYEAVVSINDGQGRSISVNHPYSVSPGEDIYLISVSADSCVLQIVREPWRYFALAGILMLLAGAFMLFIGGPRR